MTALLDRLLNLPAAVVYALVGLLVFAEDALFVGFVLPGETAAILGGVAASLSHVSLTLIALIVVAAAIIGDSVGYEVGARYGTRLLSVRPLQRRRERLEAAEETLARRGGLAVFFGRFIAFLRAVMPFLAGTSRMPYRRFLAYNAAGGLVWGVGNVLLGYLAANSYAAIEKTAGHVAAIIVAVLVIAALLAWRIRARRREHARRDSS
jgi:membrane protein DedA with SNARE-associated domain